jgi:hypothetical protein
VVQVMGGTERDRGVGRAEHCRRTWQGQAGEKCRRRERRRIRMRRNRNKN